MRRSTALLITLSASLASASSASAWTNAVELTPPGGTGTVQGVAIGMNAAGNATALWGYAPDYRLTQWSINATNHTVGQNAADGSPSWSGDASISTPGEGLALTETNNGQPRLAVGVGPTGNAVAAWSSLASNNDGQIEAASRPASGQPFGAPTLLTTTRTQCGGNTTIAPSAPVVSIAANGKGHVSWFGTCVNSTFPQPPLFTRAFDASGLAGAALTVEADGAAVSSEGGNRITPQVAEAVTGDAAVTAFAHDTSGGGRGTVYDRLTSSISDQRVTGQTYAAHTASVTPTGVRVAALPGGGALVAWILNGTVHVSVDGGPDTTIPTPGQNVIAQNFSLSAGADGTAVLAWIDTNGGAVWGAVRSPAGT
ncbi:MAG: hypothetical protein AAGC46_17510, partial [Solirubrobacteraceae bacterium]